MTVKSAKNMVDMVNLFRSTNQAETLGNLIQIVPCGRLQAQVGFLDWVQKQITNLHIPFSVIFSLIFHDILGPGATNTTDNELSGLFPSKNGGLYITENYGNLM